MCIVGRNRRVLDPLLVAGGMLTSVGAERRVTDAQAILFQTGSCTFRLPLDSSEVHLLALAGISMSQS